MKLPVIINIDKGLYFRLRNYMAENNLETISPDINQFLKEYLENKMKDEISYA